MSRKVTITLAVALALALLAGGALLLFMTRGAGVAQAPRDVSRVDPFPGHHGRPVDSTKGTKAPDDVGMKASKIGRRVPRDVEPANRPAAPTQDPSRPAAPAGGEASDTSGARIVAPAGAHRPAEVEFDRRGKAPTAAPAPAR